MKRVKLDRVIASTERLRRVGVNRQGNWLPGFLCLKANGVGPGSSRELAGTDFADFIDKYYLVPEAPDRSKPYFDPLADPPWKNANWPRGTFTSRNDRSLLIAKGVLTVTPQARLRTYELQPGYEIELEGYFVGPARIPILDFAVWMFRNEPLDDSEDGARLVERLVRTLNLSTADRSALFDETHPIETDDDLFSPDDWPIEHLAPRLEAPAAGGASEPLASEEDEGGSDPDQADVVGRVSDPTFIKSLVAHLRDVENFEIDEDFVRSVVTAMRVDRFVVLGGKAGTGKTEFVHAMHRALGAALGSIAKVHLSHVEVHSDTTEWDIIGGHNIAGEYLPSSLMRDLTVRGEDTDLHMVLFDEMNRGSVDAFAGRLLAAVSSNVALDLPGIVTTDGFPVSGKWQPRAGVAFFAAVNSPLTEPARLPLSGPVKRRAMLLPMPNPLEQIVSTGGEVGKERFIELCRKRLIPQLRRRHRRRGAPTALDADTDAKLGRELAHEVFDRLWSMAEALAPRADVTFTLGVVQSVLAYVLVSDHADQMAALDQAIVAKVIPHLQGPIDLIDVMAAAFGPALPMAQRELDQLRSVALGYGDRVSPLY